MYLEVEDGHSVIHGKLKKKKESKIIFIIKKIDYPSPTQCFSGELAF